MSETSFSPIRCGIVLAAGDGKRVGPFVHRLRGDSLPKQYVNFLGTHSMLEHTFHRAEKLISPERLFTVVSKHHLSHSEPRRQLSDRTRRTVVVQPENKETGPGLMLPLMHLYKRYGDCTVVVFPSDHFIVEEDLFMSHVEMACRTVERDCSPVVLLGMESDKPEPEYGYVVPGEVDTAPFGVRNVLRFVEKPEARIAQELILAGGLWNTMVMVFKAKSLLALVRRSAPALFRLFERIREIIGARDEEQVVERVYRRMPAVNLSRGLLEPLALEQPSFLSVLPVRGVLWSDWGSEQRIVRMVQRNGSVDQIHQDSAQREEDSLVTDEEVRVMGSLE